MNNTPKWIQPVSVAVEKINKTKANLEADFDYGVNILRKALLQNNSFEVGNLPEKEQRAARRYISKFADERDELPEYLFEGLRNQTNDWLAKEFFINKEMH
jgi:hypothetical protein